MCNNNQENNTCCVAQILQVILILQQNADCSDACLDTCDRGFLGCSTSTFVCNTRPIMLYTCCGNGTPWSMPISKNPAETETSNVFRIEKLDGCCATFRVLVPNSNQDEIATIPYEATNSFFTMDLKCCCVIRCLQDTYIECI